MNNAFPQIAPMALSHRLKRDAHATLLDVRSPTEYRSGHIPGALLVPLDELKGCDISYSFLLPGRALTGDTLLIRGTGRTDFQNGDAGAQHDSLFGRLLRLPDGILVYPAYDCNGMTISAIGEERYCNPRLQVTDRAAYIAMMDGLVLDNPKTMDVAVPANHNCGLANAAWPEMRTV
jgi:hypothetical protein